MSAVYGCHNREPLRDRATVQAGFTPVTCNPNYATDTRHQVLKVIPDPMSKDCQYTHSALGQADAKCQGCKHRAEKAS